MRAFASGVSLCVCTGDLEGWLAVVKTRNAGNSQGQNDVYFRAPTGRQFRSRNEVAKYLGLQGAAPAKGKAKAGKMVTETPTAAAVLPAAPPQVRLHVLTVWCIATRTLIHCAIKE